MNSAYDSSMCLQMTWCFGIDHICVLLMSVALGSSTQPPHQDPTPTPGPNLRTRTQPPQHSLASYIILQSNLYGFYTSLAKSLLQEAHKEKTYILHNIS